MGKILRETNLRKYVIITKLKSNMNKLDDIYSDLYNLAYEMKLKKDGVTMHSALIHTRKATQRVMEIIGRIQQFD